LTDYIKDAPISGRDYARRGPDSLSPSYFYSTCLKQRLYRP